MKERKPPGIYVIGVDLSLDHGGFILLDAETLKVERALFCSRIKKSVVAAEKAMRNVEGVHVPVFRNTYGRDWKDYERLLWWWRFFQRLRKRPEWVAAYVGIEHYAIHAKSLIHLQTAEQGGVVRTAFRHCKLRYHDPMSVKVYACGSGNAEPMVVEAACRRKWGVDWRHYNVCQGGAKPSLDLVSAYVVARMVGVEWQIRTGKLTTQDLEECELRVFNRCTLRNPENVLSRQWINQEPIQKTRYR